MNEALLEPRVRSDERLLLTIVIAVAVHVMVVLGVRLPPDAPVKARFSAMEVVLVPAPAPVSAPPGALAAAPAVDSATAEPPLLPMPPVEAPVIKAAPTPTPVQVAPVQRAAVKTAPRPKPAAAVQTPAIQTEPAATANPEHAAEPPPLPSAAQLIARSMAIAATGAGLLEEKTVNGQSKSERTLYIKSNTRNWDEIAYGDALRRKVKQHGELLQHPVPSGRVGVDVAVASDGSLVSVTITKSSAIKETDAEAIRVVENAAPFAPLPEKMARDADVAHLEFIVNISQDEGFSSGQ